MSNKLSDYLATFGDTLPQDWQQYEFSSGDKGYDCLFCDHRHDGFPVFKFSFLAQTKQKTACHSCTSCNNEIMEMVDEHYDEISLATSYESIAIRDKQREIETTFLKNVEERIWKYNHQRDFTNIIDRYYTRLNLTQDTYSRHNLCYICEKSHYDLGELLDVPVTPCSWVTGGKVRVCRECSDKLWLDEESPHMPVSCVKCNKRYYISLDTHKEWGENGTIDKHICPDCTHFEINTMPKGDIFYCPENQVPRSYPPEKFVVLTCKTCNEEFSVDISVNPRITYKIVCDDHTDFNTVRCPTCFYTRRYTGGSNKFILPIPVEKKKVFIILQQINKDTWSYKVVNIINMYDCRIVLRSPENIRGEALGIAYSATKDVLDLINNSTLHIW